jgi:hypothetical protein
VARVLLGIGTRQSHITRSSNGGQIRWTTNRGPIRLSTIFTAELRQTLLQKLSTTYSASSERERVFEDAFEVEVPPRTRMQIMLRWKKAVQIGNMRIYSDGKIIEVPFRIVVGLSVDNKNSTIKKKS